jgi:hypothetical protein
MASDGDKAAARKRNLEASAKKLEEAQRQQAECDAMWEVGGCSLASSILK